MMFKLTAVVVPLFSLFVSSTMAAGSITNCVSGCMSKAAASVGCAITDHRCVQQAIGTFKFIATQCLEDQACKTLADGTQAELESAAEAIAPRTALVPAGEFDGMLGEGASAVMSRVTPRDTGLGSPECSSCSGLGDPCGNPNGTASCIKACNEWHNYNGCCIKCPLGYCDSNGCQCQGKCTKKCSNC